MFMFWSKRTVLTRRLLKAKVRGEHETECEAQEDNDNGNSSSLSNSQQRAARSSSSRLRRHRDNAEDPARLLRCKELLKTLKENQLEMLLTAVESCGADLSSCILVPRRHLDAAADPQEGEEHLLLLRRDLQAQQLHQRQRRQSTAAVVVTTAAAAAASCGSSSPGAAALHEQLLADSQAARQYHRQRQERCRSSSTATEDEEEDNERRARDRCWGHASTATAEDEPPQLDPHLLCCQIWRWPDLAYSSELKRLPVCHSAKDPVYICCNPYHWSRLCKPESPPPPYCLIADRLRPEDRAPGEGDSHRCRNIGPLPVPGSLTTNGEGELGQKEWCTLAYWELGGRVGRLYPVEPATVNVFDSLHDGDGLCLATLAENHSASSAVQRTRSKIGLGLMLSQETDGVWAYNRSDSPIFVNSPTLDDPESRTLLVYRVPPGFCLNIFDRAKTMQQLPYANPVASTTTGFASGPVDVNSVRISFAKGWGPKYSRQEITSCPCWLEVLLAPCR